MAEIAEFFAYIKIPATITHVISVVIGMGAALVSDVLFTFYSRDRKLNKIELRTLEMLSKVVWYGLLLIALSGISLFLSDIPKYMASHKLMAKLTILGVLVLNGAMLNFRVWPHLLARGFFTTLREKGTRKLAFAGGAISVISWISICALGVLDKSPATYGVLMGLYGIVIVFGISCALAIESFEFERPKK